MLYLPCLARGHAVALALLLATLANCTQWSPHPVPMGTVATICQPGRVVYCERDNPECDAVEWAVEQVSDTVPGLMVYAGLQTREWLTDTYKMRQPVMTFVVRGTGVPEDKSQYERLPIAFTMLNSTDPMACLPSVPIVLVWPHRGLDDVEWRQVILHELLHSLGAAHADPENPFSTVMRPALTMERRVGLSVADKNWLRSVYGN